MFETPLTVIGRIVNDPQRRRVGDQDLMKFRVASNARRRTGEGTWEPGNSLFITVNCWGKLATGVGGSLGKGDAVIVVGQIYTSEYEDREGARRSSMEMRATAVGPDLSRYIARIEKHGGAAAPGGATSDITAAGTSERPDGVDSDADDPAESADSHCDDVDAAAVGGRGGLPLSA